MRILGNGERFNFLIERCSRWLRLFNASIRIKRRYAVMYWLFIVLFLLNNLSFITAFCGFFRRLGWNDGGRIVALTWNRIGFFICQLKLLIDLVFFWACRCGAFQFSLFYMEVLQLFPTTIFVGTLARFYRALNLVRRVILIFFILLYDITFHD